MSDHRFRRCAGNGKRSLLAGGATFAVLVAATVAHAGSVSSALCRDTFINSAHADNNNGGSASFFTGRAGDGGVMRGLIQCTMPAGINERVIVTQATTLSVTTVGLGTTGTNPPTAATESLYPVTVVWGEGTKVGASQSTYTVGQLCTSGEASWNQSECGIVSWTTPGGTVGPLSANAASPAAIGSTVTFTGAGVAADVQNWANTPSSNHGWLMSSSTEGSAGQAQRFASRESGAGIPALAITFTCNSSFVDTGTSCSACTSTAQASCVSSQPGNFCNDLAPPNTYSCLCNNPAYAGSGSMACTDRNECLPNHCIDKGDAGAVCTDHVAPATGYDCGCDSGFMFDGVACSDVIFADGFE